MTGPGPRRWIRVSECAETLGISVKGCYDLVAQGRIPAARIGRLVRIDRLALERDLERQAQGRQAGGSR